MATTVKGGAFGKEKRGISPSSSVVKKSPKQPLSTTQASSSSSPSEEKTSSPTDGKQIPNYLKPTISSSLDFSRLPKRPNTESSAQKPVLNRRRSFDRPPPAAQVQKAIRGVPGARDVIKPLRSSSFSNKTTISQSASSSSTRPTSSERPSVRKDVKAEPHLSKSRSLKKSTLSNPSTTMVKKDSSNVTSSSTKKKGPKSVTSESSIDYESPSVDRLVIEDDLVNIDHETQSLPEISEMPASSKELGDPANLEVEIKPPLEILLEDDHHQEDKQTATDEVIEETAPAPAPQENEAFDDHHHHDHQIEEKQPDQERVEESAKDDEKEVESEEQNQTEESAGDQDEADPTETLPGEMKEDEPSEKEADERVAEETETETETKAEDEKQDQLSTDNAAVSAPVKAQPAGKKDNQAYNDVIEETATKLMSKKNKVLALAGAFETVISLQDTNKN